VTAVRPQKGDEELRGPEGAEGGAIRIISVSRTIVASEE